MNWIRQAFFEKMFMTVLILSIPHHCFAAKPSQCSVGFTKMSRAAQAEVQEFVRQASLAESLFNTQCGSHVMLRPAQPLKAAQKKLLVKWLEDSDQFGPGNKFSYRKLEESISKLPLVTGVSFARFPIFLQEILLERDLKEGDVIAVPDEGGFSASKMHSKDQLPSFVKSLGSGVSQGLRTENNAFVFGTARDFEMIYPLAKTLDRNEEDEVNFASRTKFKVIKIIFHDEGGGTYYLKQVDESL